jgi:Uma2 family endonuclease
MANAAATPSVSKLTIEAWAELPEDTEGELVDGWIVEEEVATVIHETLVSMLIALFHVWLGGKGLVGGSNAKFKVSGARGRRPDLYVYLPGTRLPRGDAMIVDVPPDIVVEVVSAGRTDQRRDRIEKLTEYERFGVHYYWLVDPGLRSVEILELGTDARYVHAVTTSGGQVTNVPGCPNLVLDVDALWSEVDRLMTEVGDG